VGCIERSVVECSIPSDAVSQAQTTRDRDAPPWRRRDLIPTRRASSRPSDLAESSIVSEKIGMVVLPVAGEGLQGCSCAGGCNPIFYANLKDSGAAYELILVLIATKK